MAANGISVIFTFIVFCTLCPEDQIMIWIIQDKNPMQWDRTDQRDGVRNLTFSSAHSAYLTQKWTNKDILCSMLKLRPRSQSSQVLAWVFLKMSLWPVASTSAGSLLEMQICGPHPWPMESEALGVGPSSLSSRWSWCTLKFGKRCIELRCLSKDSRVFCCRSEQCESEYQLVGDCWIGRSILFHVRMD